jgi:hypothetical protein
MSAHVSNARRLAQHRRMALARRMVGSRSGCGCQVASRASASLTAVTNSSRLNGLRT